MSEPHSIPRDDASEALVALDQFGSLSEKEIVVSLLESNGIPVVMGGRYGVKSRPQVLVPRHFLAAAHRVIAIAGKTHAKAKEAPLEESRSWFTAILWIVALMVAGLIALNIIQEVVHRFSH